MSRSVLPTLSTGGDAYSVGRALGEASAHALREVVPTLDRFQALQQEWSGTDRVRSLEAAARAAWPRYVRELEGIADGAGVAFDTVFLWNCRGDLPRGGSPTPTTQAAGCTTLLIPPRDGRAGVIAHNEDDEPALHGHCRVVDVRPDDAPGFVSFHVPGLLPGHGFAVNRAGLVQTVDDVRPEDWSVGVPRHVLCRAVLDCDGLDAAVARIRDTTRAGGFHHGLGCAGDRRLLSIEAPASGCAVVEADRPRVHANHLLDQRFAHLRQVIDPSSHSRQSRAEALLAGGAVDGGGPLCVLGDVGAHLPIHRRETDPDDPGFTLATAVFRITDRGVDYEVFDDLLHPPALRGRVWAEQSRDGRRRTGMSAQALTETVLARVSRDGSDPPVPRG